MPKLSQTWPACILSIWIMYPFVSIILWALPYFLSTRRCSRFNYKFLGWSVLVLFSGKWSLEIKTWVIGVFTAIWVSLLIGPLSRQKQKYVCTHAHTPTSMYLCLKHGFKLIMPILMAYFLFINVTPFTKKPWEIWLPLSSTYFLRSSTCNQSPNYTGHILCPSLTKHSGCTGQILTLVSLTTSAMLAESSIYIEGK